MKIKKGDIVGRKSYGKDIIFIVKHIINTPNEKIAILRGLVERIEADSKIEDLELIDKKTVKKLLKELDQKLEKRIKQSGGTLEVSSNIGVIQKNIRNKGKIITGKILHLDGDSCLDNKNSHWLKAFNLKKKYLTTN